MKFRILVMGLIVSITVIAGAASQPDYRKIKKDLTVMTTIVKGAFQNGSPCNDCQIKISTNYLAEQGAVFTISNYRQHYSFSFSDDDANFYIEDAMDSIEFIPGMVGDILLGVGASLEEAGTRMEILKGGEWDRSRIKIDRTTRNQVRQLSREMRELEYEMREYEIELLHTEQEDDRKELESDIKKLETEVAKLDEKREKYNQEAETAKNERDKVRQARRAKIVERDNQRLVLVQDIVMQTFCDYGSALKNLPNDERVSIIFKRRKTGRDAIFVLTRDQVTNCNSSGKELKARALAYEY